MRVERQVMFWFAVIAAFILMIAVLRDVLLPFVVGLVLAYFFNPAADWLTARGMSRLAASAVVVVGIALVAVLAAIFLLPVIAAQTQQLVAALPGLIDKFKVLADATLRDLFGDRYPGLDASVSQASEGLSKNWADLAGAIAGFVLDRSRALFSVVSLLLITPVVMFYALVDWHTMMAKVDGWLPRANAQTLRGLGADIDRAVSAFIRGQGMVCLLLAIYYSVALAAIGLDYGLLVGLGTGLLSFIPFVGWALGLLISLALAAVQFWPDTTPMLMVLGVFLVAQAVDAAVLSPNIIGSKIGLHPVWLIFALMVFGYLFGFLGMLVAVPVAAALGVVVRFALQSYLASDLYRGALK